MELECVLLGSGGMAPMPDRLLTSMALRLAGQTYLFDAGEGVQIGLKRAHLGLRGLDLIAITHMHADHCLGLPGIIMLRAQLDPPDPLTIVGPPGIREFVMGVQRSTEFYLNYPLRFIEWSPESPALVYQDEHVSLFWAPLQHRRFCLGYRLQEHPRPGSFDAAKAKALNLPQGPLWGLLQRGEIVQNPQGQDIFPQQVLGPERPGRTVAFTVDTRPCQNLINLNKNADLSFVDSMFAPGQEDHASEKTHMTSIEAATALQQAGSKHAILAHISPRHDSEALQAMLLAAQAHHPWVELAEDAARYIVQWPQTALPETQPETQPDAPTITPVSADTAAAKKEPPPNENP